MMRGYNQQDRRLLQLMAEDMDDREIAEDLGISPIVMTERRKVLIRKMGARSPGEAIKRARRLRLI